MVTYSTFIVIAIYLILTILISWFVNQRSIGNTDFSTGGRQFGWFTAGVSILATYISAMTFIGMPGWVYQSGMEALSIHLNYPIVIFFAVVFFIPVFYRMGFTSIYEYLEHRFGVYARTINSVVFILVQCISSGVILYAIALILIQILPISIVEAIVYITLFTACYTYAGGISTVIWTDMLQSAVLIAGSVATPPASRWGTWSFTGATEYHQSSVRFGCRHHIVGGSGGCQFLTHECVRYQSIDHPKNISHEM